MERKEENQGISLNQNTNNTNSLSIQTADSIPPSASNPYLSFSLMGIVATSVAWLCASLKIDAKVGLFKRNAQVTKEPYKQPYYRFWRSKD